MSDALARRIADHLFSREGTAGAWGLMIEEVRIGYARVRMTIRHEMANGHGTVHGGMIFALADSAFAYACNSRNIATVAGGASILFLSPARIGENLIAEAREDALAGRSGSYSVAVRTADGRAVAQFQGLSRSIGGALIDEQEN
ncbi:hydroxyphenylacetyl-CoA thioesterase PaaI [Sphingobium sp. SCG-1]|uniref:hydroxyphenylacetyl-CoA thioesterase PaaI n=1 Tax=Sphingobium sp. SCG-1 TaxID=2072936 RepID=UPI0016701F5C|nr:hydroxyphenylacetyl-CoA thioesterase PaaI [Sphingobium sp. SCG-1]